ncbi:MAG: FHA domain-containing protein [Planctomycetaceae bacterium]|nr:FHA domain-containing protein [Planctomycetaceae bacterium]
MLGELIPLGGGDPVPLLKQKLLVGRRESCDIVLRFANVSAHHCELFFDNGYLYARDLQSRNGIKVNNVRVQEKRVDPGDTLSISKHKYRVDYSPAELGAVGPPPSENPSQEIMRDSLLKRAGLERVAKSYGGSSSKRYDPSNNAAGQIKLPGDAL